MNTRTATAAAAVAAVTGIAVAQQTATFDDLTPGASYVAGTSFITNGVDVAIGDLVTSSFVTSGQANVSAPGSDITGAPGTPSQELNVNNVTTILTFDAVYTELTFDFAEFGGTNTFETNGDKREFGNMAAFFATNPVIGGVSFSVVFGGAPGGERGTITGVGAFSSVSIGGQELFVDNVAAVPSPSGAAVLALGGLAAARRRRG